MRGVLWREIQADRDVLMVITMTELYHLMMPITESCEKDRPCEANLEYYRSLAIVFKYPPSVVCDSNRIAANF